MGVKKRLFFHIFVPFEPLFHDFFVFLRHDYDWRDAIWWYADHDDVVGHAHVVCATPLYASQQFWPCAMDDGGRYRPHRLAVSDTIHIRIPTDGRDAGGTHQPAVLYPRLIVVWYVHSVCTATRARQPAGMACRRPDMGAVGSRSISCRMVRRGANPPGFDGSANGRLCRVIALRADAEPYLHHAIQGLQTP